MTLLKESTIENCTFFQSQMTVLPWFFMTVIFFALLLARVIYIYTYMCVFPVCVFPVCVFFGEIFMKNVKDVEIQKSTINRWRFDIKVDPPKVWVEV